MPALLEVTALTKRFPGVLALDNVSFDLRPGEIHSLCGENGAGKSTLIKVLSGTYPAGSYEGEILLNGQKQAWQTNDDATQSGISVIHQELALVREMTVAENIFLGREPKNRWGLIDWPRVYQQTAVLLQDHGFSLDPAAIVGELGIGKQQLVEICKALAKNSRILLLDEPTAALSGQEADALLALVRNLKTRGLSCIYISHKLEEVFAISDRITVLRDGKSIGTWETAQTSRDAVVASMVGRELTEYHPWQAKTPGAPLLEISDLSVSDDLTGRPVLQNISLQARAGEVLGISGLVGSGRTELLMHLMGAGGQRTGGTVRLNSAAFFPQLPADAIAGGLVLVSEDRKRYGLVLEQNIGFNLSLASLKNFLRGPFLAHDAMFQRNQYFFEAMRIRASGQETTVRTLSGGNQQKVVLGKAMMTEPSVVLLDEPTRGIDVGAKVEVYELINRMTAAGKAVVLVSSDLPEVLGMSDRVCVLAEGRIVGEFSRAEATPERVMQASVSVS